MPPPARYRVAARAAGIRGLFSALVAAVAAWVVFGVWYPYPYRELSGGRELFLLVVAVDVVCGPLLTFVLFNPKKLRKELWMDLGLVALIQLGALAYGLWTVWEARPLYLVHEVDRFKVIAVPDVNADALRALPANLKTGFWSGPKTVGIRAPKNADESNTVLFEAAAGGRDYGARPEFDLPYDSVAAATGLVRAKPLAVFLRKQPGQQKAAELLARDKAADIAQWLYLPVIARQDWVAVLDQQGQIQGFLKGDGF